MNNYELITKLVNTIIDDKRDFDWSDEEIINELIDCGFTREDFIKCNLKWLVEDYFEDDDEYAEAWPKEFDFKSKINTFGLTYHAVEEPCRYIVTNDNNRWVYSKPKMHELLLNGDFIIID
jgi:hypothetical protein